MPATPAATTLVRQPTAPATPAVRSGSTGLQQDIATDGDVRYNAGIVGYSRDTRRRVRDTQHQVNLLVTARIRDERTAANEIHPDTLTATVKRLSVLAGLVNAGYAGMGDIRAEFASLAATAIICAEACDRPHQLGGLRLLRSSSARELRVG
jgi:hypothetical protein